MSKVTKKFLRPPQEIRKRDGRIVPFDLSRIANAIFKALEASGNPNRKIANELALIVLQKLLKKHKDSKKFTPTIEEIQDLVEETLIEKGHAKIAKAYILYREKRTEIRREKQQILNKEEIDEVDKRFDPNALRVLRSRYLRKDTSGNVIESPKELFIRVAIHAALPEIIYDKRVFNKKGSESSSEQMKEILSDEKSDELRGKLRIGNFILNRFHIKGLYRLFRRFHKEGKIKIEWETLVSMLKKNQFKEHEKTIEEFYILMVNRLFMPNTPALANFGNYLGMGSACFALDIEDSIDSIMDTLKKAAIIFKAGGGLGYNFSKLRPEGDYIKSTSGSSSGPIVFMRLFDTMTEVIKQGGIRRGANMGIMNSNHPDIEKFVTAKDGNKSLKNFNISVMIMPDFWDFYKKDKPYPLNNPRSGEVINYISPKFLVDRVAYQAWESGEPGVIFNDKVNEFNPFLKSLGPIMITNPCVVGDTLVAVADGRNYVSIRELAKEGKDVPVYCYGDGEIKIRMGRMPRKTKEKAPVWKVILDDESFLVATEDHKFRDRDNQEIKLKDLKVGTSLMPFYKFQYSPTRKNTSYWGVTPNNGKRAQAEHRMMTEFYLGRKLKRYPKEVVHHKNFDGLDNEIANLEILSQKEHDSFHQTGERNVMKGKWWQQLSEKEKERYRRKMSMALSNINNGMYDRKHNKETLETISQNVRAYYQRPENRLKHRQLMQKLLRNPAVREKISIALTKYKNVTIECLNCGKKIIKRENKPTKFCSHSCVASFTNRFRDTSRLKETLFQKNQERRQVLYDLGLKFIENNKYKPSYLEFKKFAFKHNFSGDVRSCFGGFQKFKEELEMHNHKVISIEFYGYEDVYNITVDEFHTVAYITNPNAKTKFTKKPLLSGIITSQCGEVLLYPNESCNLGSINIWAFLRKDSRDRKSIDWEGLEKTIRIAVRFLDNVIDINVFPLEDIEEMSLNTRKIGLGIMGIGSLLYDLELPFNSQNGRELMEKIAEFINYYSKLESIEICKKRGPFPYYKKSFYPEGKLPFRGFYEKKSWGLDWKEVLKAIKKYGIRNSYTTVIAPTGSISMIAGCSSGIEPVFSLAFEKNVSVGSFYYIDPVFERIMLREELFDEILIRDIVNTGGSVGKVAYIPPKFKKIFVTAHDITPEDHIKTLATFQKWVDSSISKTNNFPAHATVDDIKRSYLLAYELGCKAVTVFRDKSIKDQVLVTKDKKKEKEKEELVRMTDIKADGLAVYRDVAVSPSVIFNSSNRNGNTGSKPTHCPNCKIPLSHKEGCISCSVCGWGLCA